MIKIVDLFTERGGERERRAGEGGVGEGGGEWGVR